MENAERLIADVSATELAAQVAKLQSKRERRKIYLAKAEVKRKAKEAKNLVAENAKKQKAQDVLAKKEAQKLKEDEKKAKKKAAVEKKKEGKKRRESLKILEKKRSSVVTPMAAVAEDTQVTDGGEDKGENQKEQTSLAEEVDEPAIEDELDSYKLIQSSDFHGIIVVTTSFLAPVPEIADENRKAAYNAHVALMDIRFSGFNRKTTRLLENPSIVEFQDAMEAMQKNLNTGNNAGNYVMFQETRISTETELSLTSISDKQLADYLVAIPSKSKLVALELCQDPNVISGEILNLKGRITNNFLKNLHDMIAVKTLKKLREDEKARLKTLAEEKKAEKARLKASSAAKKETAEEPSLQVAPVVENQNYSLSLVKADPELLRTVLVESCNPATEHSVFDLDGGQSNFLHRLVDAFQGGAIPQKNKDKFGNWIEADEKLPFLYMRDLCHYLVDGVSHDATYQVEQRKSREKQNKFEKIQGKNQKPRVVGMPYGVDFTVARAPKTPQKPPPVKLVGASCFSLSITWEPPADTRGSAILGYQLQRRGAGRGDCTWIQAGRKMVGQYDDIVRYPVFQIPNSLVVRGLSPDLSFWFRIRARNSGGWGEFSDPSDTFRTLPVIKSMHFKDDVATCAAKGFRPLVALMLRSPEVGLLQRLGCQRIARMLHNVKMDSQYAEEALRCKVLSVVVPAMTSYDKDEQLQVEAALCIGRMAQYDSVREKMLKTRVSFKRRLLHIQETFPQTLFPSTFATASWALRMLSLQPSVRKYGRNEAAMKIQGLFKTRKARYALKNLASLLFERVIDPNTGAEYFYNLKTGETSWEAPKVLQ